MLEEKSMYFKDILEKAQNPSSRYRGTVFWALNGRLQPETIRQQIREFKALGLGGFFLHARTGLQTEYLSEEWFNCISSAIDEAEKCSMDPWLYDEDRYPSGPCGGIVTSHEKYRAKGIFLQEISSREIPHTPFPGNILALFAGKVHGASAKDLRKLSPEETGLLQPDETLLIFYTDTIQCSSWYNNFTYLDTLNKEAVAFFIRNTHEKYKERYGHLFGKLIPGIFTDEPRLGHVIDQPEWDTEHRSALPWTPGLLEAFQEKYGYDPKEHLPEFFFQVEEQDSFPVRVHYMNILEEFFLDAFVRPVSRWCRENNLVFTGHPVAEDSLTYQSSAIGSAMQFHEYQSMPGIDLLTEKHSAFQTAKQLSSAARQCGATRRLAELYGCAGWDFPIIGLKALGEMLYALGVNFRCEHLTLYTTEGEAKRDYPGPVGIQTNDPEAYRALQDSFARLSVWLSAGEEERKILLLLPLDSAWGAFHKNWRKTPAAEEMDENFTRITTFLLEEQLDFDYGEEAMIARMGKVNGKKFCIGKGEYSVILLPDMKNIRSSTLLLLEEFVRNGGKVISTGELPGYVDGLCRKYDFSLFEKAAPAEIKDFLHAHSSIRINDHHGDPPSSLLSQLRRGKDYDLLFLCNTGYDISKSCRCGDDASAPWVLERKKVYDSLSLSLESRFKGALLEYDPQNGLCRKVNARYCDGKWQWKTGFARLQSKLFIAIDREDKSLFAPQEERKITDPEVRILPVKDFQLIPEEKNAALLDHFAVKEAPENWIFNLKLDDSFRQQLGLPVRSGLMAQPYCRKFDEKKKGEFSFFTEFTCEFLPEGEMELVMESPQLYKVLLNGTPLELQEKGFWHKEEAWKRLTLPKKLLKKGKNILQLTTVIHDRHPGLESLYILGDFGVRMEGKSFVITPLPSSHAPGNWVESFLPFYPGKVIARKKVKLPHAAYGRFEVGSFYGSHLTIRINGEIKDTLLYAPGESRLLDLPEEFELELILSGSLRNACGPFFAADARLRCTGPDHFKMQISPTRHLIPFGLASDIKLIFQK